MQEHDVGAGVIFRIADEIIGGEQAARAAGNRPAGWAAKGIITAGIGRNARSAVGQRLRFEASIDDRNDGSFFRNGTGDNRAKNRYVVWMATKNDPSTPSPSLSVAVKPNWSDCRSWPEPE